MQVGFLIALNSAKHVMHAVKYLKCYALSACGAAANANNKRCRCSQALRRHMTVILSTSAAQSQRHAVQEALAVCPGH